MESTETASVPPSTESPQDVAQTIVSARKSWKTVPGRSEVVWPPILEQALVKALYIYRPEESRSARALGRFPKRNRFISDFIFEETGIRRSPKQVGSRLQQLKDVYCGKQLLSRVAQCPQAPKRLSSQSLGALGALHLTPTDFDSSSNDSPPYGNAWDSDSRPVDEASQTSRPPPTIRPRQIDVLIEHNPFIPNLTTADGNESTPHIPLSPLMAFRGFLTQPESVYPLTAHSTRGPLWTLEPTVTFTSREPVAAQSISTVWLAGMSVHQGSHPLVCTPPSSDVIKSDNFLYSAAVAPGYWTTLCEDYDASRYTIVQEVVSNLDLPGYRAGQTILSVLYRFSTCTTPSESPSPVDSVTNSLDAELRILFPEQGHFEHHSGAAIAGTSDDFAHTDPESWGILPHAAGYSNFTHGFANQAQTLAPFPPPAPDNLFSILQ